MGDDVINREAENVRPKSLWTGPSDDPTRYRVALIDDVPDAIGDGGEGLVFHATWGADDAEHTVALKMHTAIPAADYTRFVSRARALYGVEHPNVMRVRDAFVGAGLHDGSSTGCDDESVLYTVADWIPGRPLYEAMTDAGPILGLHWVSQIARAVGFLHSYRSDQAPFGIVHRDIKPSNVRITPDDIAVLIDFGIARPNNEDLTEGAGTYLWRAPEVLGGPGSPGPHSDAWGVGALAYWVILGEPPRLEGAEAAYERLARATQTLGLQRYEELSRHIANLLATHPDRRPSHLGQWATELDRMLAGTHQRTHWRRPRVVIPGLAGAGAIALVIVLLLTGSFGTPSASLVSAIATGYRLSTEKFTDHVQAASKWNFVGGRDGHLQATVTLLNKGSRPAHQEYDEVIPKALASSVSDIRFSPSPTSTVVADPVVRYCVEINAHSRIVLRYSVPEKVVPTIRTYVAWALQWDAGTSEDRNSSAGTACSGKAATGKGAEINSKGSGVIVHSGSGVTVVPPQQALALPPSEGGEGATPPSGSGSSQQSTAGKGGLAAPSAGAPAPGSSSSGPSSPTSPAGSSSNSPSSSSSSGSSPSSGSQGSPPPTQTQATGALTLSRMTAVANGSTVVVQVHATPDVVNVILVNEATGSKMAPDTAPVNGVATWDLTVTPGTYHLSAQGFNVPPGAGGSESNVTTVSVTVAPPTLTLTNMTATASGATVTVQVQSTPDIVNVTLVDTATGAKVAPDTAPVNGVARWTIVLDPGTYHLSAQGFNVPPGAGGSESNVTTVSVTVAPPTLTLTNMTASVNGSTVTVRVDATPDIVNVVLLNAATGTKIAADTAPVSGVATWTLTLAPGTYHLSAQGYDVPPGATGPASKATTVSVSVA